MSNNPPALAGAVNKGKRVKEPIRFLPQLPEKKVKPEWQVNVPSFQVNEATKSQEMKFAHEYLESKLF